MEELTHFDAAGATHMVDVSENSYGSVTTLPD